MQKWDTGSNLIFGSSIHSRALSLLHEGRHPHRSLQFHLTGAAHLGVAGVPVEVLLDPHRVVEEFHQLGLRDAHADDIPRSGLEGRQCTVLVKVILAKVLVNDPDPGEEPDPNGNFILFWDQSPYYASKLSKLYNFVSFQGVLPLF